MARKRQGRGPAGTPANLRELRTPRTPGVLTLALFTARCMERLAALAPEGWAFETARASGLIIVSIGGVPQGECSVLQFYRAYVKSDDLGGVLDRFETAARPMLKGPQ